jgi:plastocyanin domain-containing protein
VKPGREPAPVSEVKVPEDSFRITVTRDGFVPQEVTYKKGRPLKLAFVRTDAENCGSEVVFKSLNITKKLPVGEVVTVDIPTDREGVITFTCGMNMYKGQIVVQ